MSRYKVVLRCMLSSGTRASSPGEYRESVLLNELVAVANESVDLQEPVDDALPPGTIAKFRIDGSCITLEALTVGVSVESPPSERLPRDLDTLPLHHSDSTRRCIIHLRPFDTVIFDQHSCKISVQVQDADQHLAIDYVKQEEDVQVKSSLVEPTGAQNGAASDEETGEEDNLDVENTLQTPVKIQGNATPATSNPPGAATVKDTPIRLAATEENEVFFTVPDRQQSEDNDGPDSSPTAQAAKSQELRSEEQVYLDGGTGQSASNSFRPPATMSNTSDNSDSQYIFPPAATTKKGKIMTTYGANGTPRRSHFGTPETGSSRKIKLLKGQADEFDASGLRNEDSPAYDKSSEPMDESGAAGKAAARSTRRGSKRSLPNDDNDVAPVTGSAAKKQKQLRTNSEMTIAESNQDDQVDNQGNDLDDERPFKALVMTTTKRGRGRPSKAATPATPKYDVTTTPQPPSSGKLRIPTRQGADDNDESADEISVAPSTAKARKSSRRGSSPKVRISPRSMSEPTSTPMNGKPPSKILLSKSSHDGMKKVNNWLVKQGLTVIEDVPNKKVDFVCVVGNGELHTTAKMLRSLVLGKKVVTDEWITDSMKEGQLLELDQYIHDDLSDTADVDRSKLFKGKAIFVTTKLYDNYGPGWANVSALAKDAGASRVEFGTARQGNDKKSASNMIFLGSEKDDEDVAQLIDTYGKTVYRKEMLTQSIIRGEALLEDEDLQFTSAPPKTPARKGRKK